MKPLLTAAACALSFVALTGSIPASAQTITVDGVLRDSGRFVFELPGFGYAYLRNNETVYSLYTQQNAPHSEAPDYDEFTYLRTDKPGQQRYRWFTKNTVVGHVGNTSDIGKRIEFAEFIDADVRSYMHRESSTQKTAGGSSSFDYHYPNDDPAFVISELSTAFAALPYSGIGIFDFEQSYIYYENGSSISLADYMRQSFNAPLTEAGNHHELIFNTRNEDIFTFSWTDGNEIAGMTLAYNLTAVPEPEAWVMLLAGLGIVGAVARRRRARPRRLG
ncbi:MAG: PEP-CTERM sorting domain-containing protein [Azoarcus sp.]|jgi:hypothetical protein|nr:PEP-CTERM sorting domain-containing protein [Azoarcus sp.]